MRPPHIWNAKTFQEVSHYWSPYCTSYYKVVCALQVQCAFTVSSGTLSVTMLSNSSLAPPANYMLFAVSSQGRPSQAVYIGLGGATPATSYFIDPAVTPFFANGTYTITSRARRGACPALLSYQSCNTSNDVVMDVQGDHSSLYGNLESQISTNHEIQMLCFAALR